MPASNIYYCNEINPKKLSQTKAPREYASSIRAYIDYDKKPLFLKLPKMRIPFDPKEEKTRDGKIFMRKISVSLGPLTKDPDDNNNKHIEMFKKVIKTIDTHVAGMINGDFRGSIYESNPEYAPTFTVGVKNAYGQDTPNLELFDSKKKQLPIDKCDFNLRTWVVSGVVKLDGVWIQKRVDSSTGKRKCGIDWTLTQLMLHNVHPVAPKGPLFADKAKE